MLFFLQGKLFSITHSLTSLRLLLNVTFRVRLSLSILFKIIPLSPYNIFYLFICVIYIALTITCIRAGFFSCSLLFTAISPGLRTVPATKMLKNMLSFCLTRTYFVLHEVMLGEGDKRPNTALPWLEKCMHFPSCIWNFQ